MQESAPERLELKRSLLQAASRAAAPDTLLCSSTSGLLPSELQRGLTGPERFVVAHPFNPVYLLPLVELCGGARDGARRRSRAPRPCTAAVGMHPLVVRTEIDGFIADRLLEAMWREALWLVNDDVATVAEIDDAMRYGAGLRFALMGTFLTYRIAGGEAGMRHFLAQFGPALQWPWTKLTDVPELTDELVDKIAAQSDAQADGLLDPRARAAARRLPRRAPAGPARRSPTPAARRSPPGSAACSASATPRPGRCTRRVPADWVDYNGHVHESRYLQLFGDATDALLGAARRRRRLPRAGHLHDGRDAPLAPRPAARGRRGDGDDAGARRRREAAARLPHDRGRTASPAATAEQMLLHVDAASGRVGPAAPEIQERRGRAGGRACDAAAPRARGRRDWRLGTSTALFEPRSVAVVGVSADQNKWGYWFARDALKGAHRRQVFLVARSGGELFGQPVYREPRRPARGARARDPERPGERARAGRRRVARRRRARAGRDRGRARRAGRRGPRARGGDRRARARGGRACWSGRTASASSTRRPSSSWRRTRCRAGRSGSSRRAATSRSRPALLLADVGLGFSRLVSIGNQADLDATELVTALAAHDGDAGDRRLRRGLPRRPRLRRGGAHRRQAGRAADGRPDGGRARVPRARTPAR